MTWLPTRITRRRRCTAPACRCDTPCEPLEEDQEEAAWDELERQDHRARERRRREDDHE